MFLLQHDFDDPAESLALDEALLEWSESQPNGASEALRLWELHQPAVILGRSSRAADEVDQAYCAAQRIPILRRTSGGAAVMLGSGCLVYSVVVDLVRRPELRDIRVAHCVTLRQLVAAIARVGVKTQPAGTSDLVLAGAAEVPAALRKCSGNSLRFSRTRLLYHGTVLCQFDVGAIGGALPFPPRSPEYRNGRSHHDFLANIGVPTAALRDALAAEWNASAPLADWPRDRARELAAEKYRTSRWTLSR
jgi:lipoate-protein ligase A